jgi:CDP-4-dehydro-6-deoxyglucose reductase
MTAQVTLYPSQITFEASEGESLLTAALRAGLNVSYGCSNGSCGRCLARLKSGEVKSMAYHDFVLPEAERANGGLLMCCQAAHGDIQLEVHLSQDTSEIPVQHLTAKVRKLECCDDHTLLLQLRTPRSQTLRFIAGQHARLQLTEQLQRELPVASCPCNGRNLEFHIHRNSGDCFSDYAFNKLAIGTQIVVEGPTGDFTLVEDDPNPILFIAWGTGFGPIRSLIEHCLSLELTQPIMLYWVIHEDEVHYAKGYCRAVADAFDNFNFTALQTNTAAEALQYIQAHTETLNDWRVYIAAPPAIIDRCIEQLGRIGLKAGKVKSDPLVA